VNVPLWLGATAAALAAGSVVDAVTRRRRKGTFLGVAYDWRAPTLARVRERVWNPADRRIFTPKELGWGWTINLGRVWELIRRAARPTG
jgi:hypothetical protein